jgi:hypothetical protein
MYLLREKGTLLCGSGFGFGSSKKLMPVSGSSKTSVHGSVSAKHYWLTAVVKGVNEHCKRIYIVEGK